MPPRLPCRTLSHASLTDVTGDAAADLVFFDRPTLRLAFFPSNRISQLMDGEAGAKLWTGGLHSLYSRGEGDSLMSPGACGCGPHGGSRLPTLQSSPGYTRPPSPADTDGEGITWFELSTISARCKSLGEDCFLLAADVNGDSLNDAVLVRGCGTSRVRGSL